MVHEITPHKGGRTIKKSTDVTPADAIILSEIKGQGISLGDVIHWALMPKQLAKMLEDKKAERINYEV